MNIDVGFDAMTVAQATPRSLELAMMFGLRIEGEARRQVIVPKARVVVPRGGIVFITGPSGGGKSTLLKQLARGCANAGARVWSIDARGAVESPQDHWEAPTVFAPGRPLIDAHGLSLTQAAEALAAAGLGEAAVMLRAPEHLSDGQRWRLGLAEAMARLMQVEQSQQRRGAYDTESIVIIADEFGATLDRLTAMALARSVRRWMDRRTASDASPACTIICATTHDDLLEAFDPDVLVFKGFGDDLAIEQRIRMNARTTTPRRGGEPCGAN